MSTKTKPESKTQSTLDLKRKVSIRQYVDPDVFNLGMEKYNMSVWSGETGSGGHKEWLGCKEIGNKKVYLTGLDVNADSLKDLDEDTREQKIEEIKSVINHLAETYGEETLKPTNEAFWRDQFLEITTPVLELDLESTADLLIYYAIKGRGYSEVAPSYEFAKNATKIYKFYLHEDEEVAVQKTELKKLRNKAKMMLEDLDNEDYEKLFKVAKMLLPIEKGLTRKTPKDTVYQELDNFIEGDYSKNEIKLAPKKFMEMANRDRATLNIQATVREALYQRYITKNSENLYWNSQTQVSYGRNENEIIAYLSNPINQEELKQILSRVEAYWK